MLVLYLSFYDVNMSNFLVSARKYRPQTFERVLGQDSITSTLKTSIKNNQLAQSFLFCGPRGVGKTSLARILAKTINCDNLTENQDSCDKCISCTSFNENNSFNIHELDAASNNSVDDIRKLVDQVRFAPQVGEYNIYIIDEVHMLSTQAFNAFLKTLEEPPSHAKFILATTEKHKIIPTILSRCQIFDFKKSTIEDIVKNLKYVASKESIEFEDESLALIAEKSDGALRDSLSLFDRLVTSADGKLTYSDVIKHLNILDYDYYFKVSDSLFKNNISQLFLIFNEILNNGFDGQHFINGLASHLRNLLICQDSVTIDLLEKSDDLKSRYLEQAGKTSSSYLVKALKFCNECDVQYNISNNKRLLVEICLMQISSIGYSAELKKKSKNFVVSKVFDKQIPNDNIKGIDKEKKIQKEISLEKKSKIEIKEYSVNDDIVDVTDVTDLKEKIPVPPQQINPQAISVDSNKKSKTISISNLLSKNNDQRKEDITISNVNLKEFSKEDLIFNWKEMISILKKNGKSNLAITLGIYEPILLDNFLIEVPLSNSSQIELVFHEKQNILQILRSRLGNDKLDLKTVVVESEKRDVAYTNKDKFNKMLEKNPNLQVLREKLGLDPEY
jgi:DNA polymerase-3 subunit gamma/tau